MNAKTGSLSNLSGCELIESPFALQSDYARGIALDYFAEIAEQLLPAARAEREVFPALDSRAGLSPRRRWHRPARTSGVTGSDANPAAPGSVVPAGSGAEIWTAILYVSLWAVRLAGVFPEMRVSRESAEIAEEMFAKPLKALTPRAVDQGHRVRSAPPAVRAMEQHVERKFITVPLLEAL